MIELWRVADEIQIIISFVDGERYCQPLPIDHADGVQRFIDWYRDPGNDLVWTWQTPSSGAMFLIHHRHIVYIEVKGYIEPQGQPSKWHERWLDRLGIWWIQWRA